MSTPSDPRPYDSPAPHPQELADAAVAKVRSWLTEQTPAQDDAKRSRRKLPNRADLAARLLANTLKYPGGLPFTLGFVDRVVRPEDPAVAADNLAALARTDTRFLPLPLRGVVALGGRVAPLVPKLVVPIAQRVLRELVGHLIVDARDAQLGTKIRELKGPKEKGLRLNLNLLGEAVLGDAEADARLEGTRRLLARPDVDYVSIKVSSVVNQLNLWAYEQTLETVVQRLTPLFELAANSTPRKFINLDMEEYHDLNLTIDVFTRLLDLPQLKDLEAGIVLQAYLPDALGALQHLTEWADRRTAAGGAGIKVRLVKGANLPMELVDAGLHGWDVATYTEKVDSDTNYKRVLDWVMTPERMKSVRIGVAGHNLFDVALATLLADARGVSDRIEFEMLIGMAAEQAERVRAEVGGLLLYTPVVDPKHFDVAISYLTRRLEENASQENFMSAVFEIADSQELFEREQARFRHALDRLDRVVPDRHRHQSPDRAPALTAGDFANSDDSDASLPEVRRWATEVIGAMENSQLGVKTLSESAVESVEQAEQCISTALSAQLSWAARSGHERAEQLRKVAVELGRRRGDLIEVAGSETGKIIAEGDVEVSEAIDFANYYARQAELLDEVDGATFTPPAVTVATPPWNFPLAITAGSVLAPLAAGSAVVLKPAPQARRCAAVIAECLWQAGISKSLLVLADAEEGPVGQHLIAHPKVERVILTGAYDTAKLFRSWRHDLPLLAETSGKNSIIVTPSADFDLAAADVVKSAFGHAGQKCSAASLVILVGSAAQSQRFRNQLLDSASSLKIGQPWHAITEMGPVAEAAEAAEGKLLSGLTELAPGETWLMKPEKLDQEGKLWSPGIRDGVAPGSTYHLTEYFGPILGIITAETLEEAIDHQNGTDYGLTAGIHSLDPDEVSLWLEKAQAGNLYVNRGITGAIVERQPFGGWKRSSVGPGTKAGGPNFVATLGSWQPAPLRDPATAEPEPRIGELITACRELSDDADWARRGAAEDQAAWQREFGVHRDVCDLGVERNEFRYLPVPVRVHLAADGHVDQLVRVLAAGVRAGSQLDVSLDSAHSGAEELARVLRRCGLVVHTADHQSWLKQLAAAPAGRLRLIGGDPAEVTRATDGTPDLALYSAAPTLAGRVELLPFLHEQAISITGHRFGNPDVVSTAVLQDGSAAGRGRLAKPASRS